VIRTIWLGIFLFVGLVALASFKLAFGSQRTAAIAERQEVASDREIGTVATNVALDTLKKSDRLQVTYVSAAEPVAMVAPLPVAPDSPVIEAPKITSRHWHDPSDQKIVQVPTRKPTGSKKASPAFERKPVLEANACKPGGIDRIKRLFNHAATCQNND
jgi:hypothetical protein